MDLFIYWKIVKSREELKLFLHTSLRLAILKEIHSTPLE